MFGLERGTIGAVDLQILQAFYYIRGVEPSPHVTKDTVDLHLGCQVASRVKLHDEVEILFVAECGIELGDERVVRIRHGYPPKNAHFGHGMCKLVVGENGSLRNCLHGQD